MFKVINISVSEYKELLEIKTKYNMLTNVLVKEICDILSPVLETFKSIDWEKYCELKERDRK